LPAHLIEPLARVSAKANAERLNLTSKLDAAPDADVTMEEMP
jgi:hypothetical protein